LFRHGGGRGKIGRKGVRIETAAAGQTHGGGDEDGKSKAARPKENLGG